MSTLTHTNRPGHETRRRLAWIAIAAGTLICPPLLGVIVTGLPVARYFQFPPYNQYIVHAGYAWSAFALFALIAILMLSALAFLAWPRAATQTRSRSAGGANRRFPAAGWVALLALGVSWLFAWTRWPALAVIQSYSFIPLWLSYIGLINALTWWRSGTCLWCRDRRFFLALFPTSALFWWYFEYLNRFVQNWQYTGIQVNSAGSYFLHATLAFSTVLPAVASTQEWLATFPRLRRGWSRPLTIKHPRILAGVALVVSLGILFALGIWPNVLFPMVWVGPLGVLLALESVTTTIRGRNYLAPLSSGRWEVIYLPALAALCCGVCWEMWNEYSAAKWVYHIAYVERWKIFEMPLLGYVGYLPFGIQCAVAIDLLRRALPEPRVDDHRRAGPAVDDGR